MDERAEEVQTEQPVVLRHRVRWGECDPAGVVYTPRFSEYVVAAVDYFYECLLGEPLQEKLRDLDLGLPAKALSFEFKRSLRPDQRFDMSVRVGEIRNRTFDLCVGAIDLEGNELFVATFTPICVRQGVRVGRPIPPPLKDLLTIYRDNCRAV